MPPPYSLFKNIFLPNLSSAAGGDFLAVLLGKLSLKIFLPKTR
jgi:hypothetical protein